MAKASIITLLFLFLHCNCGNNFLLLDMHIDVACKNKMDYKYTTVWSVTVLAVYPHPIKAYVGKKNRHITYK